MSKQCSRSSGCTPSTQPLPSSCSKLRPVKSSHGLLKKLQFVDARHPNHDQCSVRQYPEMLFTFGQHLFRPRATRSTRLLKSALQNNPLGMHSSTMIVPERTVHRFDQFSRSVNEIVNLWAPVEWFGRCRDACQER